MSVGQGFNRELREYNQRLATRCGDLGMTFKTYKIIKAITQLVAVAGGIFAITEGADPTMVFGLIAFIVSGPEALEYVIALQDNTSE